MSIDLPGFADPVAGAQSAFLAALNALARPGQIQATGETLAPPAPLGQAAAALLLTLADTDTRVFLAPAYAPAADWIRFHCGAPVVTDIADADFIVADSLPDLATLATGTDEQPQDGATLLLHCTSLRQGPTFHIAGPGLPAPATLTADLPPDFPARWAANHALFPRGIDLILCAGSELLALPRSLHITEL
jgi:alpha-D-ribose 1-methylphosphonate 5-triphosphate synthase subunit PhnH